MCAIAIAPRISFRPELTQIRRGYSASWNDLALCIESETGGWKVGVQDRSADRPLYQAHRLDARSAKTAAVEFAMFQHPAAGHQSPEEMAEHLSWKEYW